MPETIDNFFDRAYISFIHEKVLVFPSEKVKNTLKAKRPERWDFETTRNYLDWLESQNEMDNQEHQ